MSLSPREIAANALIREEGLLQNSIGHFIYWFSQLEFTIKMRLASALDLPQDLFDIIIGPYDFAMLCTVTERTLMRDASKPDQARIKKYFNDCRKLNQEAVSSSHMQVGRLKALDTSAETLSRPSITSPRRLIWTSRPRKQNG